MGTDEHPDEHPEPAAPRDVPGCTTCGDRRFRSQAPPTDADLWLAAGRQDGIITTAQLRAAGLTIDAQTRRTASGRLFRIHRGVHSLVPPRLLTVRARRLAAVLACGDGAALSHLTAAIHTGFVSRAAPGAVDVTVPRRSNRARAGLRLHRSTTLARNDVVTTYGVPTTTPARTVLDISCILGRDDDLEDAIDTAIRLDLLTVRSLHDQIARNATRPPARRLAAILQGRDAIATLTETQLEKILFTALRTAGLPLPQPQVWIDPQDGGTRIRADFLYLAERLIIETDGWRVHRHRREEDARRDQRAATAGFRTLRATRRQVVRELPRVIATITTVHAECRAQAIAAGRIDPAAPPRQLWVPSGTTVRARDIRRRAA